MSEQQVRTTRRRSRAEAEQLVAEFEASGLGREEFCRAHGLVSSTLARYRKRRQRDQSDTAAPHRWVAVELAGSHQAGAGLSMFGLGPATKIYLAAGATDMRKGFEGLYGLARDRLLCDPPSGHVFLFSNAQRNREKGRFHWPEAVGGQARVVLSHEELALLLGGIDPAGSRRRRWHRIVTPGDEQLA